MHVNYQWVLHFYNYLVILLVEQLEVDSSLNDHKVYIFTYIYIYIFFFAATRTDGRKVSKTKEHKSMKNPLSFFIIFSVVVLKFRISNASACCKTVKLWSQSWREGYI